MGYTQLQDASSQEAGVSRPARISYFQWARALGAIAIVALHAFVTVHRYVDPEVLGQSRLMIEEGLTVVIGRWAVPVFFMVSGALMLDPSREMGWRKTLRHVWRLGFVLLTFGFGFCIAECVVKEGVLTWAVVSEAFLNLWRELSWGHMWYVYTLLGYYLLTPIIRPWVAQATRREYAWVVGVAAILLLGLGAVSQIVGYRLYKGVFISNNIVYYLLGYYLHRYLRFDGRWLAAGLAGLAAMMVLDVGLGLSWTIDPVFGFALPYGVLVLLLIRHYLDGVPIERFPLLATIEACSFGIYITHPIFDHLLMRLLDAAHMNAVVLAAIMIVVPLVASTLLTLVLRRIPGFADKL